MPEKPPAATRRIILKTSRTQKDKRIKQEDINIAQIIYEAYPHFDLLPIDPGWDCCDLASLLERVTTFDIGDGLFKFIVIEIVEGGESTLDGAIRVMRRARDDVQAVLNALQTAKNSSPKASEKVVYSEQDNVPS